MWGYVRSCKVINAISHQSRKQFHRFRWYAGRETPINLKDLNHFFWQGIKFERISTVILCTTSRSKPFPMSLLQNTKKDDKMATCEHMQSVSPQPVLALRGPSVKTWFLLGTLQTTPGLWRTETTEIDICRDLGIYEMDLTMNPYFKHRAASEGYLSGSYWLQIELTQWDASRRDASHDKQAPCYFVFPSS